MAFRKKVYDSLEALQIDADNWIRSYNEERPHSRRFCYGKTPMQTFLDARKLAQEKMLDGTRGTCDQQETADRAAV